MERVTWKNIEFTIFDMAGNPRYRDLWVVPFRDTHAIIYMIDSTDANRIDCARRELFNLLGHQGI
jgi:GTPase SAR1 family protein